LQQVEKDEQDARRYVSLCSLLPLVARAKLKMFGASQDLSYGVVPRLCHLHVPRRPEPETLDCCLAGRTRDDLGSRERNLTGLLLVLDNITISLFFMRCRILNFQSHVVYQVSNLQPIP
jgi:hypothetical protein